MIDSLAVVGVLSREEIETRSKVISYLWSLLRIKDSQVIQGSISNWLNVGDANFGFFHAFVKNRSRRNIILTLKVR